MYAVKLVDGYFLEIVKEIELGEEPVAETWHSTCCFVAFLWGPSLKSVLIEFGFGKSLTCYTHSGKVRPHLTRLSSYITRRHHLLFGKRSIVLWACCFPNRFAYTRKSNPIRLLLAIWGIRVQLCLPRRWCRRTSVCATAGNFSSHAALSILAGASLLCCVADGSLLRLLCAFYILTWIRAYEMWQKGRPSRSNIMSFAFRMELFTWKILLFVSCRLVHNLPMILGLNWGFSRDPRVRMSAAGINNQLLASTASLVLAQTAFVFTLRFSLTTSSTVPCAFINF